MEDIQLLFFETFTHEASEEINLDLVQFPKPVVIGEVRIIPLGARVQADFPGGVRLGATNPSQFKIEFFVNDLSKPGASTFENLGTIDYNQNGNIHMECEQKITTDGLVLRGLYTTITLAIYGALSKVAEPATGQVSLQDQTATQQSVHPDWQQNQMRKENREVSHYMSYPSENCPQQEYPRYSWPPPAAAQGGHGELDSTKMNYDGDASRDSRDEKLWTKERIESTYSRSERSPSEYSRDHGTPEYDGSRRREYYNAGSIGGTSGTPGSWDWSKRPRTPPPTPPAQPPTPPPPPPPLSSSQTKDENNKVDDTNTSSIKAFDVALSPGDVESISEGDIVEEESPPFEQLSDDDFDLPDYSQFQDMDEDLPDCNEDLFKVFDPYAYEVKSFKNLKSPVYDEWCCKKKDKSVQLANLISSVRDPKQSRVSWVETVDDLLTLLPAIINDSYIEDKLVEWVEFGVNYEEAMEQTEPTLKVRHIKAGVRLAEAAAMSGLAGRLIKMLNIHHILLDLYHKGHMAHSIRGMILRSLDSFITEPACLNEFLSRTESTVGGGESAYCRLLATLTGSGPAAARYPAAPLIVKIHFAELLDVLASVSRANSKLDVEKTSHCLKEIYRVYREAPRLLSHPVRFLPVSAMFSMPVQVPDPTLRLYGYFKSKEFLSSIEYLIPCGEPSVVTPILGILVDMSNCSHGLRFLSSESSIQNVLRVIYSVEPQVAISIVYKMKTLEIVDNLLSIEQVDSLQLIDLLTELFALALSATGSKHVLQVLSWEENVQVLFKFLSDKACSKKRSPTRGYITDLISLIVKSCPNADFLLNHATKIMEFSSEFTEFNDIVPWLKPALSTPITYDNFSAVYDYVKNNVDECVNLPGELITAIRILKYLAIPEYENSLLPIPPEFKELKYKFVVLKIYSLGGLGDFVNILKRITSNYEQPIMHTPGLSGKKGCLLLDLLLPTLQLLRRMLVHVIHCRNSDFKDLTAIPALLKVYNFLLTMPANSQAEMEIKLACNEIVEALLGYTQPTDEEQLSKSLWTLLIQEVVKWTIEIPMNFLSGCVLLSELLPLPLPVMTKRNLTEEEIAQTVNWRKLWSAHIHSANRIEEMVAMFCCSGHQPLIEALRRVCLQLSDLAAPTAVSLMRCLFDCVSDCPTDRSRILSFIGTLASHPPVKAAIIYLLTPEMGKLEDRYLNLFLTQFENAQCIEGLLAIIQPLCYQDISLVKVDTSCPSFPLPKEVINHSFIVMSKHLMSLDITPALVVCILRILCLMVEHDYGLYHAKQSLEKLKSSGCFKSIVDRFHFDAEVCNWCVAVGLSLLVARTPRTMVLPLSEVVALFNFDQENPDAHPLSVLSGKVKTETEEDKSSKLHKENLESFLSILKTDRSDDTDSKELSEVTQSEVKDIMWQFAHRTVYLKNDSADIEKLSPSYWLSPPHYRTYVEPDKNQITVDLTEVAEKEVNGWNEAVLELCRKTAGVCQERDLKQNAGKPNPRPTNKLPFVAPKLGRGTGGSAMNTGGGGTATSDVFRSRPPNTSRPPSLHVDDFVALETCGAQPTGPTGYNKLTMRAAQDLLGLRGGVMRPGQGVMRGGGASVASVLSKQQDRHPDGRGARFFGQSYMAPLPPPNPFDYYHHHF